MLNPNDITIEDSYIALKNEIQDINEKFNPERVKIEYLEVKSGFLTNLKITVYAPTFVISRKDILELEKDAEKKLVPKSVDHIVFYVDVPEKFPAVGPKFYYDQDNILASVNVYRTGVQCINTWLEGSSLLGAFEKTIRDIIHVPVVTKFNSMANGDLEAWQRELFASGTVPTINPKLIFRDSLESLQKKKINMTTSSGNTSGRMPRPVANVSGQARNVASVVGTAQSAVSRPVVNATLGSRPVVNRPIVGQVRVNQTATVNRSIAGNVVSQSARVNRPVVNTSAGNRPVVNRPATSRVAAGSVQRPSNY